MNNWMIKLIIYSNLPAHIKVVLADNCVRYMETIWIAAANPGSQLIAIVAIPYCHISGCTSDLHNE